MSDEESRDCFTSYLKGRIHQSYAFHKLSGYPEYKHPICRAVLGDTVLEAGLQNGKSSILFSQQIGSNGTVLGFEADPYNWELIQEAIKQYPNVKLVRMGVWNKNSKVFFTVGKSGGSRIVSPGTPGASQVDVTKIDDYLQRTGVAKIDLIKMDIEGAEMNALRGAKNTILRDHPKLMICTYHLKNDFFDILFFLDELRCGYKFYYGNHMTSHTGTCLYAIAR